MESMGPNLKLQNKHKLRLFHRARLPLICIFRFDPAYSLDAGNALRACGDVVYECFEGVELVAHFVGFGFGSSAGSAGLKGMAGLLGFVS